MKLLNKADNRNFRDFPDNCKVILNSLYRTFQLNLIYFWFRFLNFYYTGSHYELWHWKCHFEARNTKNYNQSYSRKSCKSL